VRGAGQKTRVGPDKLEVPVRSRCGGRGCVSDGALVVCSESVSRRAKVEDASVLPGARQRRASPRFTPSNIRLTLLYTTTHDHHKHRPLLLT